MMMTEFITYPHLQAYINSARTLLHNTVRYDQKDVPTDKDWYEENWLNMIEAIAKQHQDWGFKYDVADDFSAGTLTVRKEHRAYRHYLNLIDCESQERAFTID